jgi:hypothetical protein
LDINIEEETFDSFFNVINWKKGENYEAALRKNISSFNKKKMLMQPYGSASVFFN